MVSSGDKSEIVFFDVETTVPTRPGQGYAILEFGAILVCSKKLMELENYSTLVRPANLSLISNRSVRCNGITTDDVVSAPGFADIADRVYDILHGRIWAGHNILRFDCARIREAFAEINRPAPTPKGTIDSLALLTQRFGRRAGDMKMATLATYFGLGQQTHRSLDDVRMNLEVLKYCATILFLESSLPEIFVENNCVSPNATTGRHSNGNSSPETTSLTAIKPSYSCEIKDQVALSVNHADGENHPVLSVYGNIDVPGFVGPSYATENSFNMGLLGRQLEGSFLRSEDVMEEEESDLTSRESTTAPASEGTLSCCDFLEPDVISTPSISVVLAPFCLGLQKVQILHKGIALQICCKRLKVRFGVSTKFVDAAGRPRLSFVTDASPSICQILDTSDGLAQKLCVDSGSSSEWRPVVTRKPGFINSPTIRLHLPTMADGNTVRWATEIYHKESSAAQRLVFSRFDVTELDPLLCPGNFVDAYFSVDTYDYQQNAGIRLVAKKLVVHSC